MEYWNNFSDKQLREVNEGVEYSEEWVDISGYEGQYSVSNFGRFRSLKREISYGKVSYTKELSFLKQVFSGDYLTVNLCKNAKYKRMYSHILVGKHFLKNPENKKTINHKKGNKVFNAFFELEWSTHKENLTHAKKMGLNNRIGETHHWAKLNKSEVTKIYKSGLSSEELSKKYKVSAGQITNIKRGRSWASVTGGI